MLSKEAFSQIIAPEFNQDIISLNWLREIRMEDSKVYIDLVLPTFALKSEREMALQVKQIAYKTLPEGTEIELNVFAEVMPAVEQSIKKEGVSDVKNILMVMSGKGGVGKSTVSANLAKSLASFGCRVGLVDADVYGPSVPTLFNLKKDVEIYGIAKEGSKENYMIPVESGEESKKIKLMSIGFLVDTSSAMIWRGPMIASACMQMFNNVAWGDLDYLIIDMPPGTGDIQLTLSQKLNISGAIIVSTPQELALADVTRAKSMLDKLNIPSFGLIENMSYFVCDSCDKKHEIFSHNKAFELAEQLGVPKLSRIPIDSNLNYNSELYKNLAQDIAAKIAIAAIDHLNKPIKEKIKPKPSALNILGQ